MCYNKEVSIVLFIIGVALVIKYIKKYFESESENDSNNPNKSKYIGIVYFLSILSIMQLNEFFLHLYDNPKTTGHQISSLMIPITILIQLTLILTVFLTIYKDNEEIKKTIISLYVISLLILLYFAKNVFIKDYGTYNSTPKCKNGCRLEWSIMNNMRKYNYVLYYLFYFIYFIMTGFFVYYLFDLTGLLIYLFIYFLSFIIHPNAQWSSFFCLFYFFIMLGLLITDTF